MEETLEDVLDILSFEDAKEVLVSNHSLAVAFLSGSWYSNNGLGFIIRENGSVSSNLTSIRYGDYYVIEDGIYKTSPSNNENATRDIFKFTIEEKDRIKVYCYKDGSTHILYRQ